MVYAKIFQRCRGYRVNISGREAAVFHEFLFYSELGVQSVQICRLHIILFESIYYIITVFLQLFYLLPWLLDIISESYG